MRNIARPALALATLTLVACETGNVPPANPQQVVDERVAVMKSLGAALAATNAFVQGKGTAPAAQAKLSPARNNALRIPQMFPRGTALGDKGVAKSRALSTIFTNRSDFDNKANTLLAKLDQLESALTGNSKADTTAALTTTKAACASCHDKYRAADE